MGILRSGDKSEIKKIFISGEIEISMKRSNTADSPLQMSPSEFEEAISVVFLILLIPQII